MCESRNEIVSYSLLCRPLAIFRGKFMILTLWNSSLRYGTYVPYRIPFGLVYSYCVFIFFIFLSCFVIVSVAVAGCVFFFLHSFYSASTRNSLVWHLHFCILGSHTFAKTCKHWTHNQFSCECNLQTQKETVKTKKKYRTKKRFFARWFAVDERKRNTAPYSTIRLHRTNDSQPTILYAFTFRYWPKQDCFRHCV